MKMLLHNNIPLHLIKI